MYVCQIIQAIKIAKSKGLSIPIVYNSNGYENVDTIKMLDGIVDIYLPDFKYYSNEYSVKYSKCNDYFKYASAAIDEMVRQKGDCIFDNNGNMISGVIVRHLLLPQSTRDAIEVFDWVKQNLSNSYFSFMSQYVPLYKAKNMPIINRKITDREYNKVVDYILNSEFEKCYIQDLSSATKEYIPSFDFTGI